MFPERFKTKPYFLSLSPGAQAVHRTLRQAGYQVYVVGGYVRDALLKRSRAAYDLDFTTNATPEQMMQVFKVSSAFRVLPTGLQYGTLTVFYRQAALPPEHFEITTFRTEGRYLDGRRPQTVRFGVSLAEDLKRRDFTINALVYDPEEKIILELFDGLAHLEKKELHAILAAEARFLEDALRMFRAVRFAATLNFSLSGAVLRAIKKLKAKALLVAKERIRVEFMKGLAAPSPGSCVRSLSLLLETGLLELVFPELFQLVGFEQNRYHAYDVYTHSLKVMEAITLTRREVVLALALRLLQVLKRLEQEQAEFLALQEKQPALFKAWTEGKTLLTGLRRRITLLREVVKQKQVLAVAEVLSAFSCVRPGVPLSLLPSRAKLEKKRPASEQQSGALAFERLKQLHQALSAPVPQLHLKAQTPTVVLSPLTSGYAVPNWDLLRLAALFHDTGKVKTRIIPKGKTVADATFYGHEVVGEKITRTFMQRFKFPKADISFVTHLVRHHMFFYTAEWSEAAVRRFIRTVGTEALIYLFALRRADRLGKAPSDKRATPAATEEQPQEELATLSALIVEQLSQSTSFTLADLRLKGGELMKQLGLTPGPLVGKTLNHLLECVLDDPKLNQPDRLLALAKNFLAKESLLKENNSP